MTGFRALLQSGDLEALRSVWAAACPHLPQPETREQAEFVMHRARTEAMSVTFPARAYSHAWLVERGLPSGLPDELKPRAQRIYPVIAECVGISVRFTSPMFKAAVPIVRQAMSDAVCDAYSHGMREPVFVKSRMMEAKDKTMRLLFGIG